MIKTSSVILLIYSLFYFKEGRNCFTTVCSQLFGFNVIQYLNLSQYLFYNHMLKCIH